ncbi:cystatin-1-like [Ornithodoros turicata]|uniref:cystatin-1-like n=1 Tax=Ornithodoros turicata TaxID=34597 RepID=UPI0031395232
MGVVRFAVVFLAVAMICVAKKAKDNGWTKKDESKPFYLALAHIAASEYSKTQGLSHYYTVKKLLKVEVQTVSGVNYKLKMKVAPSTCNVDEKYNKKTCKPQKNAEAKTCTAVIHVPPGNTNEVLKEEVTEFHCKAGSKATLR